MASTESLNEQYSRFKATITTFPYKCRMFFSLLIGLFDEASTTQVPKAIRKNYEPFTTAFKHLSPAERAHFLAHATNYAATRLNGAKPPPIGAIISQIETTCETRSSFYGVSYWEKRNFKFELAGMVIRLSNPKRLEVVELKNYLVRQSLSEKYALVLEGSEAYLSESKLKITIRFANRSIFEEIYANVRNAVQEIAHRRVELLLSQEARDGQRVQEEVAVKGLTFLTQRIVNDYLDSKQGLLKKLRARATMTFTIYSKGSLQIRNSSQGNKYYYLDYVLPATVNSLETARAAINILSTQNIPHRFYCERLESFAQNISAKYYKITTDSLECQSVMIVETVEREGRLQRLMKATESVFLGVSLPFMCMELRRAEDNRYMFSLQAIIKLTGKGNKSRDAIKLLLSMVTLTDDTSQLNTTFTKSPPLEQAVDTTPPTRKKSYSDKSKMNQMSVFLQPSINELSKVERRDSSDNEEEEFYSIENEEIEEVQDALNHFSSKLVHIPTEHAAMQEQSPFQQTLSFLKAKPFMIPLKEYQRKFIGENFLSRDWKKLGKGGVICINEAVVAEQKKIFKLICKQFGSKLFKMQGIMSFSLPVQICRPESALISIARNVSYAPLLFQSYLTMSPFELIKNTVIFEISMAVLALSTQSPFNPIIGETYQGSINGCPIFMEQVSHHPAITYMLFIGRGFRVFGAIGPQICIRLNYVKGINSKWLTVEFDNGQRLEFSVPTMIINGMLFGDRTIYFDSTNYVIDQKNCLIAEIVFNSGNKSFFGPKDNPDCLTADIYQVTPPFMESFLASKRTLSPKKDERNKLLAGITGEWDGKLILNQAPIFDFEKDLPLLLQNFGYPLESDSVYRSDAMNLLNGAIERAQEEKQRLQQLQRRDKKLREDHSKHHKHK